MKSRERRTRPAATDKPQANGTKRAQTQGARLSAAEYADGIRAGNRTILAKAITLIESSRASDRDLADEVTDSCLVPGNNSIRIGITGVPGAGKSTLIEALGRHIVTDCGQRVAVLSVDPTSPNGGGSILGDKTRMNFLASSDMAFIRPSPTRGILGGVAQHTRDAIALCEAAGYQNVFVETVGVGQSETAVRDMVDSFLLITVPRMGDELQAIKRGIMEMADAVVVNKAEGENLPAAKRAQADAQNALRLQPAYTPGWKPPVLVCSARFGLGIPAIWSCILDHKRTAAASGWREELRGHQRLRWFHDNIRDGLLQRFVSNPLVHERIPQLEREIAAGHLSAVSGARKLLDSCLSGRSIRRR